MLLVTMTYLKFYHLGIHKSAYAFLCTVIYEAVFYLNQIQDLHMQGRPWHVRGPSEQCFMTSSCSVNRATIFLRKWPI